MNIIYSNKSIPPFIIYRQYDLNTTLDNTKVLKHAKCSYGMYMLIKFIKSIIYCFIENIFKLNYSCIN